MINLHRFIWKQILDITLLLFLVLTGSIVVVLYLSHEAFFYYWDYGGFQSVALSLANDFLQSPLTTLIRIKNSVNLEYNYLYSLPLIPFISILGQSRSSYVLSVAFVYQLPYSMVAGAIATRLVSTNRRAVFWFTAVLAIMTPILWVPTLRAYPDIGGALFLASAIMVFMIDLELNHWWQIILIGFFLAISILFRRHFTFGVIAFFLAGILNSLILFVPKARANRGYNINYLLISWIKIGIIGVVCLITLAIIGWPFLSRIITTDYYSLYSSYSLEPKQIFANFVSNYGWVTWIIAGSGFIIGIITKTLERSATAFILSFGIISLLLWTFFARQNGIHYTLHTTLIIILGLVAFFWTAYILSSSYIRVLALMIITSFIVMNAVIGLTRIKVDHRLRPLFSKSYPPLFRSDCNEVIHLVSYLREITNTTDQIYVVDSSFIMNYDLLLKAEQDLYKQDQKLNIQVTPQIDSRDYYPLELLLKADYLILTTPLQTHLSNPEEQKVVEVVYKAFTENWEISRDFTLLQRQFSLANGANLSIYHRSRPTPLGTALQYFTKTKEFIGNRPANQNDWIIISQPSPISLTQNQDNSFHTEFRFSEGSTKSSLSLLFADKSPEHGKIVGTLKFSTQKCKDTILGIQISDIRGQVVKKNEGTFNNPPMTIDFSFDFIAPEGETLLFYIHRIDNDPFNDDCQTIIDWKLEK